MANQHSRIPQLLPSNRCPKDPSKIHAICSHVEPRCLKTGVGLGVSTEQSLESAHSDFDAMWAKSFSITNTDHPRYAQLLRCVVAYNSRHIPHTAIRQFVEDGRGSTLKTTGSPHIHEGPGQVPEMYLLCLLYHRNIIMFEVTSLLCSVVYIYSTHICENIWRDVCDIDTSESTYKSWGIIVGFVFCLFNV